jgi:putative hemolysin
MVLIYTIPLLVITFILMQGFFSNSEMAMVSANKIKFNSMARSGNKNAGIILQFLNEPEQLFGTTLVGINFATVLATYFSEFFYQNVLISYLPLLKNFVSAELFTLIILEPAILVFGELFPMSIARKYPNVTCLRNAKIIKISFIIFYPLTIIVTNISKLIEKLLKTKEGEFGKLSRSELQILMAGKVHHITDKTRKIIEDVFDINELTAEDVMIHLNDVKAISSNATVGELREYISTTNYSRIPVYSENIFNITATIHAISILGIDNSESIIPYTEKLYIIPSSKPVVQVLSDLKRNRKYMGIVVDEHGTTAGIITIENIAEELIGEIKDEFEKEVEKTFTEENIFDGQMPLDDFYEQTGIDFSDEDVQTLSGIINLALGRIGRKGDIVFYRDIEFEVIEASDRVVKTIKLINTSETK